MWPLFTFGSQITLLTSCAAFVFGIFYWSDCDWNITHTHKYVWNTFILSNLKCKNLTMNLYTETGRRYKGIKNHLFPFVAWSRNPFYDDPQVRTIVPQRHSEAVMDIIRCAGTRCNSHFSIVLPWDKEWRPLVWQIQHNTDSSDPFKCQLKSFTICFVTNIHNNFYSNLVAVVNHLLIKDKTITLCLKATCWVNTIKWEYSKTPDSDAAWSEGDIRNC